MDGPGIAAIITAVGSIITGVLAIMRGRQRERAEGTGPVADPEIDAALRAVEMWRSIVADLEDARNNEKRAKEEALALLDEERERRFAAERRLAKYEPVESVDDERTKKPRRHSDS